MRDVGCFENGSTVALMKATKSTYIRMFHYKLIHRIIATNMYLKMIRIKESDLCSFCKEESETLSHMFWYCPVVKSFIESVHEIIFSEFLGRYILKN